jgi:lipopolysaccharide transport system ATP-binding protein
MTAAITVTNVSKAYKRYPGKWARALEWLTGRPRHEKTWVLRDINFTVQPGEAVGIIGVNGAGKSTLLKIITGTAQPTTGSVQIQGRVAALLELGMGFHPDFTGRQNAFMAGQLLGYRVEEIAALMPEIEAFAEIGDYIDRPVRVYSSGMQVRLAFAVATAARPDVLIVDEALAVGDAAFQRKCYRRIENFRTQGTTLLFVSHDIETIKCLCDKALFIDHKRIEAHGKAKFVCDTYEQRLFGTSGGNPNVNQPPKQPVVFEMPLEIGIIENQYGNSAAEITDLLIFDETGKPINTILAGETFSINYQVKFKQKCGSVEFGMMIKSVEGVCVYGTNTERRRLPKNFDAGETADVQFKLHGNLVPGTYFLNVGVADYSGESAIFLHRKVDAASFKIAHIDSNIEMGYANMFALISVQNKKEFNHSGATRAL